MRLVLIRHGETEHNAGRLALGQADVPLNARGLAQAEALAGKVRALGAIEAVYASPLERARRTAAPLAAAVGLPVETLAGLIEMDIGELEGLEFSAVRERYPDFMRRWLSDEVGDAIMPGGESLAQVRERAWAEVDSLRDRHGDATVAAVTHNFVILTLLCRALDLPLSRFRRLRHDLASVSIVDVGSERATLVSMNDSCHLPDDG